MIAACCSGTIWCISSWSRLYPYEWKFTVTYFKKTHKKWKNYGNIRPFLIGTVKYEFWVFRFRFSSCYKDAFFGHCTRISRNEDLVFRLRFSGVIRSGLRIIIPGIFLKKSQNPWTASLKFICCETAYDLSKQVVEWHNSSLALRYLLDAL